MDPAPDPAPSAPSATTDGTVAYNEVRSIPRAGSPYDGAWHMATVSSQPGGGRGYRLYLDGGLVNEVTEGGPSLVSPEGFPIPVGARAGWLLWVAVWAALLPSGSCLMSERRGGPAGLRQRPHLTQNAPPCPPASPPPSLPSPPHAAPSAPLPTG